MNAFVLTNMSVEHKRMEAILPAGKVGPRGDQLRRSRPHWGGRQGHACIARIQVEQTHIRAQIHTGKHLQLRHTRQHIHRIHIQSHRHSRGDHDPRWQGERRMRLGGRSPSRTLPVQEQHWQRSRHKSPSCPEHICMEQLRFQRQ